MKYLAPDYVYTSNGLQTDVLVTISDDGHIVSVTPREREDAMNVASTDKPVEYLRNTILLPGFVNVHSHVFQRALRGHTHRSFSKQDTFWTWCNAMYTEAQRLDPDRLYRLALHTYREMVMAGYTTVGEFHYVHHQPDGQPYANPNVMAEAIVEAGRTAGIRVVLLMTAYAQAGFNQPPEEARDDFVTLRLRLFWNVLTLYGSKAYL